MRPRGPRIQAKQVHGAETSRSRPTLVDQADQYFCTNKFCFIEGAKEATKIELALEKATRNPILTSWSAKHRQ